MFVGQLSCAFRILHKHHRTCGGNPSSPVTVKRGVGFVLGAAPIISINDKHLVWSEIVLSVSDIGWLFYGRDGAKSVLAYYAVLKQSEDLT